MMKTIKVVAAIICDSLENVTEIFAAARGYGEFRGQWEFPGGKVELGESSQEALVREIDTLVEELAAFAYTIRRGDRDNLRTMLHRARTIKETIDQDG